jgi:hypothetical protein
VSVNRARVAVSLMTSALLSRRTSTAYPFGSSRNCGRDGRKAVATCDGRMPCGCLTSPVRRGEVGRAATTIDPVSTKEELRTTPRTRRGHPDCPTAVATEVLLLRPHAVPERATTEKTGRWPLFVMVVTEPTDRAASLALPLFELLNRPKHPNELSIVAVESAWSVLDLGNALLTMTVRAAVPISFDLRILLPAAPVLDILDLVAHGATIGVTTRERADRLRGRLDVRTALREVVLLSCPPSAELAHLAGVLRAFREG